MMTLLTSERFRLMMLSMLPNRIATARGETPFESKLAEFITDSEGWLSDNITGPHTFELLCEGENYPEASEAMMTAVAADAWLAALPALDLVLTANGMAVVSNDTLSPASTARTAALLASLRERRDRAHVRLLRELRADERIGWLGTERSAFFGSTLFPDVAVCVQVRTEQEFGSMFEKYEWLHPRLRDIEDSLAEEWVSPELMGALRAGELTGTAPALEAALTARLRRVVLSVVQGSPIPSREMQDIVNYIRLRPRIFPAWHDSDTAKLFTPPVFRNKQQAAGYFF